MYTVEDGLLMKMLDYFNFIFPKVHFMGTSNALHALVLLLSITDNWNWHLYHCSLVLILVHIKRTQCFSLEMTINQVSETFLSTFFLQCDSKLSAQGWWIGFHINVSRSWFYAEKQTPSWQYHRMVSPGKVD